MTEKKGFSFSSTLIQPEVVSDDAAKAAANEEAAKKAADDAAKAAANEEAAKKAADDAAKAAAGAGSGETGDNGKPDPVSRFLKKSKNANPQEPDYKKLYEDTLASSEKFKKDVSEIWETPVFNKLVEAKTKGLDAKQVLAPLFESDPEKLSHEDLIRRDLERKGYKPADVELEIDNFKLISSEYQKQIITSPLLAKEKELYQESLKTIGIDEFLKAKQPPKEEVEFVAKFSQEVTNNSGKEVFGFVQDSKTTKQLLDRVSKGAIHKEYEDGKLNLDKTYLVTLFANDPEAFIGTILSAGREDGINFAEEQFKSGRPLHVGANGGGVRETDLNERVRSKKVKLTFGDAPSN